jgi:uncharacterized protein (DUF934 family)
MAPRRLIKDGRIVEDTWTLLRPGEDGALPAVPPTGPVIVPLALWKRDGELLLERDDRLGVWLASHEDPADIAEDIDCFGVIAVDFPAFNDGRGYSTARLLRERYGYRGELRAIGDVLRDQLFYMHRCGFNAFAVREDRSIEEALKGLSDFSEGYQVSVERPVPYFRRRAA